MRRFRSLPADFMGGRGYTRAWAAAFPGRLHYVTTLHDSRGPDALALLVEELNRGALGAKVFPAYLRCLPDAPEIRTAFDVLRERSSAAAFGFEDTSPPTRRRCARSTRAIGRLAADYPDVPIQLNHGANADPFGADVGAPLRGGTGTSRTCSCRHRCSVAS